MGNTRPPHLPPEKSVWRSRSNSWKGHGTMDWFLIEKGVYFHLVYLTYMQSISCEIPGWMKHKLELRLLGEISITSDMQNNPYGRK